jgi:hypothetical protein
VCNDVVRKRNRLAHDPPKPGMGVNEDSIAFRDDDMLLTRPRAKEDDIARLDGTFDRH